MPGSADLCFLVEGSLDDVAQVLADAGVPIELGPVERLGAVGSIESLYVRDPDGNLVELAPAMSDGPVPFGRVPRYSGPVPPFLGTQAMLPRLLQGPGLFC